MTKKKNIHRLNSASVSGNAGVWRKLNLQMPGGILSTAQGFSPLGGGATDYTIVVNVLDKSQQKLKYLFNLFNTLYMEMFVLRG